MRGRASVPGFCLNVGMSKMPIWMVLAAALIGAGSAIAPAIAYEGRWLVVENLETRTCYRMTGLPDGKSWRRLGVFNTFREAGMWTWEHRGICRSSPVFS